MIRIAVCDDRKEYQDALCRYIEEYMAEKGDMESEISRFFSGDELIEKIKVTPFDIYFLDILMPGTNGVEVGRMIREADQMSVIVYVTVSREFAFEAFGVRAFQYLEKPVKKEELFDVLDRIFYLLEEKKSYRVCIRTKEGLVNVKVSDILYIENIDRCAVYVLRDKRELVSLCNRRSFEASIGVLLGHPAFIQPHKSYFVNMHYIRSFGPKSLMLDDGTQVAISRNRFGETKKRYLEFLTDRGEII